MTEVNTQFLLEIDLQANLSNYVYIISLGLRATFKKNFVLSECPAHLFVLLALHIVMFFCEYDDNAMLNI